MTHLSTTTQVKEGKYALPSSLYDVAKDAQQIYLPATGVLYVSLATIWGWGYTVEVSATLTAIILFLGVVLKISTTSYNNSDKGNDGVLVVDQTDPKTDKYLLDVTTALDEVATKDTITLRVNTVDADSQ